MSTIQHDPFRALDRRFDRLFNEGLRDSVGQRPGPSCRWTSTGPARRSSPTSTCPGVDPESIDIDVEDRTLTVRAERSAPEAEDAQWLSRERPSGTFARQLSLGRGLALDRIEADYSDGVLTLTIPVAEEAKPRRISVSHAGSGRRAIESSSGDDGSPSGSSPA